MSGAHGGIALLTAVLLALNCAGMVILASAGQAVRMCTAQCERDQRDLAARSGLYLGAAMVAACREDTWSRTVTCVLGPHRLEVGCSTILAEDQIAAPGRSTVVRDGATEVPVGRAGVPPVARSFSITVSVDGLPALACVIESSGGVLGVRRLQPLPAKKPERLLGR
ncbi:MAG: hypothetical protein Q8P50_02610 [Bacillota bacterium]|nr:hypothetical protein [Bacillota bacterium]